MSEAVELAGGAICDRTLSGWEVTVDVPAGSDIRPIVILGARVRDTATVALEEDAPTVVVVECGKVDPAPQRPRTGSGHWRAESRRTATNPRVITHEASSAAAAFKRCALQAAGQDHEPPERAEHFRWVAIS